MDYQYLDITDSYQGNKEVTRMFFDHDYIDYDSDFDPIGFYDDDDDDIDIVEWRYSGDYVYDDSKASEHTSNSNIIDDQHGRHLQKGLGERLQSGEFADITLKAGSYSVQAHKLVLSLVSDYFVVTFSSTWRDTVGETLSLDGLTAVGLRSIVEYAYSGELKVDRETLVDVLEAARYLLASRVTELCDQYLVSEIIKIDRQSEDIFELCEIAVQFSLKESCNMCVPCIQDLGIDMSNYQDILLCAKSLSSKPLIKKACDFIGRNCSILKNTEDLLSLLDHDDMTRVLQFDRHGILMRQVGLSLVDFLARWVEQDPDDRHHYLVELFNLLNLAVYDVETLKDMLSFPLISQSEHCRVQVEGILDDEVTFLNCDNASDYLVSIRGSCMKLQNIVNNTEPAITGVLPSSVFTGHHQQHEEIEKIVVYGSKLYVVCWSYANVKNLLVYCYEPTRHNWIQFPPLPDARSEAAYVATSDSFYVLGGHKRSDWTDCVDVFDMRDQVWSPGVHLPVKLKDPKAAVLNSVVYCGRDVRKPDGAVLRSSRRVLGLYTSLPSIASNNMFSLCVDERRWASVPLPSIEPGIALIPCRGKFLYKKRGLGVECYDPQTNQWTDLSQQDFEALDIRRIKSPQFSSGKDLIVDDNGKTHYFNFEEVYPYGIRMQCVLEIPHRSIELLKRDDTV